MNGHSVFHRVDHSQARLPTSVVLRDLLGNAPGDRVTLAWLIERLGDRSFGVVLLLLALLALLPGVCTFAAVLLLVPAFQMVRGHHGPIFARRLAAYELKTQRLAALIDRIAPVLQYLERFIRPRWATPFETTKRAVGIVVFLLAISMLAPVPLSNVPPALTVVLVAFAYLEEDGALLSFALVVALVLLMVLAAIVWEAVSIAGWLSKFL